MLIFLFMNFVLCGLGFPFSDNDDLVQIVGGEEASPGQFPYQIQVLLNGELHCGGILFNENWIISAAHCFQFPKINYTIVAGEHDILVNEGFEQYRTIQKIVKHPLYGKGKGLTHDITLIQVVAPFRFGERVRPFQTLPKQFQETPAGTLGIVAGWGLLEAGGNSSNVLRYVAIPIVSHEVCVNNYKVFESTLPILESMVCAGLPEGGKDACQIDSGGPLICRENDEDYVCGIASFAFGCALADFPGVNTKVSYYRDWILDTIQSSDQIYIEPSGV